MREVKKALQAKGQQLIGFAKVHLPKDTHPEGYDFIGQGKLLEALSNLEFAGFVSVESKINPKAAATIQSIKKAGIKVILLTNDSYVTACSMGAELGLFSRERADELMEKTTISISDTIGAKELVVSREDLMKEIDDPDNPQGISKWFLKDHLILSELNGSDKTRIAELLKRYGRRVCFVSNDE